ncbi:hypothetical protein PXH67_08405 [Streptomyces sp. P8-A8]
MSPCVHTPGDTSWVHDSPGAYKNAGEQIPPDGDWTFMARALRAATLYE